MTAETEGSDSSFGDTCTTSTSFCVVCNGCGTETVVGPECRSCPGVISEGVIVSVRTELDAPGTDVEGVDTVCWGKTAGPSDGPGLLATEGKPALSGIEVGR